MNQNVYVSDLLYLIPLINNLKNDKYYVLNNMHINMLFFILCIHSFGECHRDDINKG